MAMKIDGLWSFRYSWRDRRATIMHAHWPAGGKRVKFGINLANIGPRSAWFLRRMVSLLNAKAPA